MNKQAFIMGTMILILGNILTKILGFIYRIYISNAIGAEGMGLFQLIFPVYLLLLTVTTSGLSMAVSNLIAKEAAKRNFMNIKKLVKIALLIVFVFSTILSLGIYLNIHWIAEKLLKDSRTYSSLLILLPCIPIITSTSVIKGYFYGMKNMLPSAISQLIEQSIRIAAVVSMLQLLQNQPLEIACAYAMGGMMLGELGSCFYIFWIYKKETLSRELSFSYKKASSTKMLAHSLLAMAIPISLSRMVTSLMQTAESILIPAKLQMAGFTHGEALSILGKLSGMAMPLIFFPAMITIALSTNLIPTLSEAKTLKQTQSLRKAIYLSIQFTLLIGFLSFGLFYFFGSTISKAFYKAAGVGELLQSLSFLCIVLYLEFTLYGILNGIGKQMTIFINGVIGSILRLVGIYYFVPMLAVKAILFSFLFSMSVTCILNLASVIRSTGIILDIGNWIILPGGAAVLSGLSTLILVKHNILFSSYPFMQLFLIGTVFTCIYVLLLLLFGCISMRNISHLIREIKLSKARA